MGSAERPVGSHARLQGVFGLSSSVLRRSAVERSLYGPRLTLAFVGQNTDCPLRKLGLEECVGTP